MTTWSRLKYEGFCRPTDPPSRDGRRWSEFRKMILDMVRIGLTSDTGRTQSLLGMLLRHTSRVQVRAFYDDHHYIIITRAGDRPRFSCNREAARYDTVKWHVNPADLPFLCPSCTAATVQTADVNYREMYNARVNNRETLLPSQPQIKTKYSGRFRAMGNFVENSLDYENYHL